MTNPIKSTNAPLFVDELWQNLIKMNSWSKADLFDYLLYLFNKYDERKFFDSNSNATNERLLKISASKIKATKKNIAVKFMSDDEYEGIFEDFLSAVANGKIAIKDGSEGKIRFIIENPVFRNVLEARLKESVQESFDYTLNSEKVEISTHAFVKMLENEANKKDKSSALNEVLKECKASKNIQNISALLTHISKAPSDLGASFVREVVPHFCKMIYKKFTKKG